MKKKKTKQNNLEYKKREPKCCAKRWGLYVSFAAQIRHWGSRTSSHKVKNVFTFVS